VLELLNLRCRDLPELAQLLAEILFDSHAARDVADEHVESRRVGRIPPEGALDVERRSVSALREEFHRVHRAVRRIAAQVKHHVLAGAALALLDELGQWTSESRRWRPEEHVARGVGPRHNAAFAVDLEGGRSRGGGHFATA